MSNIQKITLDSKYIVRDKSTSDGSQIKYNFDNKWYKIDNFGGEAEAETLTTLLLECSNLSKDQFVHYEKILINDQLGCVSTDFRTDIDKDEFVTLYRLYKNITGRDLASITAKMDYDDAINYVIDFVKNTINLDISTYLANTFYLDEIIRNTDRHFNNYGVIMNNGSYSLAPIFDNGKSLLTGVKNIESTSIESAIKSTFSKSFSPSFNLNSLYLKKYRTLKFDKNKVLAMIENYEETLQKKVLLYQLRLLK